MKKKIIKTSLSIFLVICLLGVATFQLLISDYNPFFNKEKVQHLKNEIRIAKKLPIGFHTAYQSMYNVTSTFGKIYTYIPIVQKQQGHGKCPCLTSSWQNRNYNHQVKLGGAYFLSWNLEKQFSQEECLDYLASQQDFLYGNIGIDSAARFYFEKPLDSLNHRELKILAVMMSNPSLYNPKKSPERLEKRLRMLDAVDSLKQKK